MSFMNKTIRINEIVSQINAFEKESYYREDLLPELLELQRQLVQLVFNDTHAEFGQLRIWDVENHLKSMNEECGHCADKELQKVFESCKIICNMIKSEFSGMAGEKKAFWSLQKVRCQNQILKNVEFKEGRHRTELDAVMFTSKAVFVIEVKNPGKDIFIDERGNYCRIGQTMVFDKNIGEKMNDKIFFLRKALQRAGVEDPNIINIVVFTNNAIEVENRYPYINTCFLSDLPYIIENYEGENIYGEECIEKMVESVEQSVCKESYPLPIDMKQFKFDFASALVRIEEASSGKEQTSGEMLAEPACDKETLGTGFDNGVEKGVNEDKSPVEHLDNHSNLILGAGVILTAAGIFAAYLRKGVRR